MQKPYMPKSTISGVCAPSHASMARGMGNATPIQRFATSGIIRPPNSRLSPGAPSYTPNGLANQMAQMTIEETDIQQQAEQFFVASLAPGKSDVTNDWHRRGRTESQMTQLTSTQAFSKGLTNCGKLNINNFAKGDIISVPFHTANMNPNVDTAKDLKIVDTIYGPVYSKRRMMIVLYKHIEDLFCLPLFTWSCRGMSSRPSNLRLEYVGVANANDRKYKNEGKYAPVVADCRRKPMHPATSVHLTGGYKVNCKEDINQVGRIDQQSYAHLESLYTDRINIARKEPYKVFANGKGRK